MRPGRDVTVAPGSKVWINYFASLDGADEPFDTSMTLQRPFTFKLGQGKVLPGLDIAVQSMAVREIAKFLIDPEYAYGPLGCQPRIPPSEFIYLFIVVILS